MSLPIEMLGQRPPECVVADQQVGAVAAGLADFEDRSALADEARHVEQGPQPHSLDHAERHDRMAVAVHHRGHVGTAAVDLAVDEALQIDLAPLRVHGLAVQRELHDVVGRDLARRHVAGEEEAVGDAVVADADMAEGIHHALVEQDVVGEHELLDQAAGGLGRRTGAVRHRYGGGLAMGVVSVRAHGR